MAKTRLRSDHHSIYPGANAVEVWWEDKLIAVVYGSDEPGIRVVSKYPMDASRYGLGDDVGLMEVTINPIPLEAL